MRNRFGLPGRNVSGIVRKLKVPWNPEAGFGSVTWDGKVYLNQELVRLLALSGEEISRAIAETQENIRKRLETFLRKTPLPALGGRTVIITDDGLASGYTMLAAAEAVRAAEPGQIIIAIPTGSVGAVAVLSGKAYNYQLAWNPGSPFTNPAGADDCWRWTRRD